MINSITSTATARNSNGIIYLIRAHISISNTARTCHAYAHTHTRAHTTHFSFFFLHCKARVCARVNIIYIINAFARPGWPNQSGHHRRTTTDRHSLESFEQKCAHEIAPLQRHQCLHKHLSIFFLHRARARTQPTHARGMSIICLCSPLASQSPCRCCCCCMAPHTWLGI